MIDQWIDESIDTKMISNYSDNQFLPQVLFKPKILWFQLPKCDYKLVFLVFYHDKLDLFWFSTVANWINQFGLWEIGLN